MERLRLAAVDCHGRIADRPIMAALGWTPGMRLNIQEHVSLLFITADPHGVFKITKDGHVRLPADVRHIAGITTDRSRCRRVVPPATPGATHHPGC